MTPHTHLRGLIVATLCVFAAARAVSSQPREFIGTATTNLTWSAQLQYNYTKAHRDFLHSAATSIDVAFGSQDDYYSTIISSLSQVSGNVGLGFRIFFWPNTTATTKTVMGALLGASNASAMGFTMRDVDIDGVFHAASEEMDTPIEFWEVGLIAGGVLVFVLFVIIIILAIGNRRLMKLVRQARIGEDPWSLEKGLGMSNPFTSTRRGSFNLQPRLDSLPGHNGVRTREPHGLQTFSSEDLRTTF